MPAAPARPATATRCLRRSTITLPTVGLSNGTCARIGVTRDSAVGGFPSAPAHISAAPLHPPLATQLRCCLGAAPLLAAERAHALDLMALPRGRLRDLNGGSAE